MIHRMTIADQQQRFDPLGRPPRTRNGLGIAGIVLGATSFLFIFIPVVGIVGALLAFVGLVLAVIALFLRTHARPTAIIGAALSAIALLLAIVTGVLYLSAFAAGINEATRDDSSVVPEPTPEDDAPAPSTGSDDAPSPDGSLDTPLA